MEPLAKRVRLQHTTLPTELILTIVQLTEKPLQTWGLVCKWIRHETMQLLYPLPDLLTKERPDNLYFLNNPWQDLINGACKRAYDPVSSNTCSVKLKKMQGIAPLIPGGQRQFFLLLHWCNYGETQAATYVNVKFNRLKSEFRRDAKQALRAYFNRPKAVFHLSTDPIDYEKATRLAVNTLKPFWDEIRPFAEFVAYYYPVLAGFILQGF